MGTFGGVLHQFMRLAMSDSNFQAGMALIKIQDTILPLFFGFRKHIYRHTYEVS